MGHAKAKAGRWRMKTDNVNEFEHSGPHEDGSTSAVVGMIGCFVALFLMLAA
jgi:hypothetical protein